MQLYPEICLTLAPVIEDESATGIICCMSIPDPRSSPAKHLLSLPIVSNGVPTQDYTIIKAHDQDGDLFLKKSIKGNTVSWFVNRITSGDVSIEFLVRPRKVDKDTPIRPRIDVRSDNGGLLGCGITFIPTLNLDFEVFDYTVAWDLTSAPAYWSATWTFSLGSGPTTHRGDRELLQGTYFCVGPVHRIESPDARFGIYWFGTPLANIMRAARASEKLFRYFTSFFEEDNPEPEPYKIFIRDASPARGFGGSAGIRSYCLEFDASSGDLSTDDVEQLLAHEMLHNWPVIGSLGDTDHEQFMLAWFNEGIANLYAVLLPYRANAISEKQFVEQLNDMLSSYYTHPYRNYSQKRLADLGWNDVYAGTLSYFRGMVYLLRVWIQLEQQGPGIFDNIIRSLSVSNGERHDSSEWNSAIKRYLGDSGIRDFQDMLDGSLVTLPERGLGPGYQLKAEQRGTFDLCMDPSSYNERVIRGIHPGKRAEQAGLRNGDRIVDNSFIWLCEQHYASTLQVAVERKGQRLQFSYWPRSREAVTVWQFVSSATPTVR